MLGAGLYEANEAGRVLEAGFAEASEHIGFVGFNTRLVERIDALELGGDGAGEFEEINESAERTGGKIGGFDFENGDAARAMRSDGGVEGVLVNKAKVLAGEIVQTVEILDARRDYEIYHWGLLEFQHGLENIASTVLQILTERVEISGIDNRGWKNSLTLLPFGFAEELLPPFLEILELWLESGKDFNVVAFGSKGGTGSSVFNSRCVFELVIENIVIFGGSAP